MKNEQHTPTDIAIKDKKKAFQGKVSEVAIFARSKVLHVITTESEHFYLIYYNQTLIFGEKLDEVMEGSFIEKSFHDGVVLESSHPLLSKVTPSPSVTIPNRSKVFSQLPSHFSPQEIAYIATTLDSFFEKEVLMKEIEKIYFQFKRNGKYMKAYQVLQILSDYLPLSQIVNERLSSFDFNSYHHLYLPSNLPSLFEKDPLYVELYCYKNRKDPEISEFIEDILISKSSYAEIILLWLEKVKQTHSVMFIEKYTRMALKIVKMKEWIFILSQVEINPFQELPDAKLIINEMMEEGDYETAAIAMLNFIDVLPKDYDSILKSLWGKLTPEFILSHLESFIAFLKKQINEENHEESEDQIFQLIVNLLERHDLETVYNKLKELPPSAFIGKLKKMMEIIEDPNRMMELGDLYAEFKQFDQAIDCYFWEMELHHQDPEPVRKICKMYQNKGMAIEAAAYRKIYAQLKEKI